MCIRDRHGAGRVAEVEDLLASLVIDVLDIGSTIILAIVTEGPVPESLLIDSVRGVMLGVFSTTVVSHPDIVASLSQLEHHGQVRVLRAKQHPLSCVVVTAMLDKYGWPA